MELSKKCVHLGGRVIAIEGSFGVAIIHPPPPSGPGQVAPSAAVPSESGMGRECQALWRKRAKTGKSVSEGAKRTNGGSGAGRRAEEADKVRRGEGERRTAAGRRATGQERGGASSTRRTGSAPTNGPIQPGAGMPRAFSRGIEKGLVPRSFEVNLPSLERYSRAGRRSASRGQR